MSSNSSPKDHSNNPEEDQTIAPTPNKIATFVASLKNYDNVTYTAHFDGITQWMILSFDAANSEQYDQSLCDFDAIATELFKVGETWANHELICLVVTSLSKLHGWEHAVNRRKINCNRSGTTNLREATKTPRNLEGGQLLGGEG